MATIAIGDIHGNLFPLVDLLGQLQRQAGEDDTVVFLGDYIDRGANSKECVDAILAFRAESRAKVVCLCGNHEDWMLRALRDYRRHSWLLGMEARDTIRSYSADAARLLYEAALDAGAELYRSRVELPYGLFFDAVPRAHLDFFEGLLPYYRSADCICTHGGINSRVARLEDQTRDGVIWGGDDFPYDYRGTETIVYGHRNNAIVDGEGWPNPNIIGNTIGLDTISHGVLTAIRLPDRQVFQSARYD